MQSRLPVVTQPDLLVTDDFVEVASAIVQSMSASPALNREPPATMQLGEVNNGTLLNVEMETLLARSTTSLFRSGRVVRWDANIDTQSEPELILRARIYEVQSGANKLRSKGSYIRLTLVERSTGSYIWSEERKVRKKLKAPADAQ